MKTREMVGEASFLSTLQTVRWVCSNAACCKRTAKRRWYLFRSTRPAEFEAFDCGFEQKRMQYV